MIMTDCKIDLLKEKLLTAPEAAEETHSSIFQENESLQAMHVPSHACLPGFGNNVYKFVIFLGLEITMLNDGRNC